MTCRDAAERITALVDGELPADERAALEAHLAGCPACREARAAEEEVARRVRSLGRPPLPGGFREAVMGRVLAATPPSAGAPRPLGRVIPLWAWMAAGTAAAAGILAMVTWGGGEARRATDVASGAPPQAEKPAAARGARDAGSEAEESPKGPLRAEAPPPPERSPAPLPDPAPVAGPPPPPAAPRPAPEKDAARADVDRESERRKEAPAEPATEDARAEAGPQDKAKEEEKAPAAARGRLAVFYRTLHPADAEQRVDRALFLHRDLALEKVGWKDAAEVESSLGRLLRDGNVATGLTAGFAEGRTRDRVLQVRLRSRDLERLRAEMAKIESMREASTLVLIESSGRAPADVEKAIRESLAELARKEAEAQEAAAGGKAFKPDAAGGQATREPGEPAPPPMPSKELLKRLAEGGSPPRAGAAAPAKAPEADEVWVEIHVVASPPPR